MDISIVIATKGRVKLLIELLESIRVARDNYPFQSEVLLIDDSSEADRKRIEEACGLYDAKMYYYSPSVSGKRNFGVKMAVYDTILFLDSDCIATPHLLEEHAKQYINEKVGAVAGPLEFVGKENWFWKSVVLTPYLICFKMPLWGETSPWGTTANFSVRKEVFLKVGGFDEGFPNKPGGEDVDLGLRIVENGYVIRNTQNGLVYHNKETWSQIRGMFRRAWHYGAADYYLIDRHPKYVADAVPRRTLVNLLVAAFCIILMVVSPWFLAGMAEWLLLDIVTMSVAMSRFGYKKSSVWHQMVAQLLILANEMGFLSMCIRKKAPRYMFGQMVYFDNQINGISYNGNHYFWCFIANFCICMSTIMVFR